MMLLTSLLILSASDPMPAPPMVSIEESIGGPCTTCERGGFTGPQTKPIGRDGTRFKFTGEVPPGFHLVTERNYGLVGAGTAMFAVSYFAYGLFGAALGSPEALIPFVGPIVAFRSSSGWFAGAADFLAVMAITIDVGAQLAGVIMLIAGISNPKRWLERDVTAAASPTISFAPMAPGADLGASLVGRF